MLGDPVVFLPPAMCDARVFLHQIGRLSVNCPVLTIPNMIAETIGEMADHALNVAPAQFTLVGAGMGGMIALEMIHRAPDRITRIALINTVAQADTPKIAADRETQIIAAKAGRLDDVIAHEFDGARLHSEADVPRFASLFRSMGETLGAEGYIAQARALQKRKDQQAILRKIRQPALVISGTSDPELLLRRQEFIAEMIPFAEHCVIEQAGFMPTLEQSERVSTALSDWIWKPLVLR